MSGRFIVLEGPDGAGTSLHSRLLAERLEREGHSTLLTAEPTDGPIGNWIRHILNGDETMPPESLQLLFCADRAWHVQSVIKPALEEGKIVVCDRYSLSTILYGDVQGVDSEWLREVNSAFIQPDTLILTLPPFEVTQERLARREEKDMFEVADLPRRVYDAYRAYADSNPNVRVVDTSGEKADVAEEIYEMAMNSL